MKKIKNLQTLFLVIVFLLIATPVLAVDNGIISIMNELVEKSEITGKEIENEAEKVIEEALALSEITKELSEEIKKQEEAENDMSKGEVEDLEGVDLKKIEKAPGALGLWFRGIMENTSLVFTFDSVKKAEKRLRFAEERMRVIKIMTENAEDPKVAKRIVKIVLKAESFIEKIEKNRDKVAKKMGDKNDKFLENIAKHRINKEKVLEKIEDKIPVEKLEKFQEMRKKISERNAEFFSNILGRKGQSKELVEKIKEKSRDLRVIIAKREKVREEIKQLLDKAKEGDETAREKLKIKREKLKEKVVKTRGDVGEKRRGLINRVKKGDGEAILELKSLNMKDQSKVRRALDAQNMVKILLKRETGKGDKKAKEKLDIINEREARIRRRVLEAIESKTFVVN